VQAAGRPQTAHALHADAARRHADAPVGVFDSGLGGLSVLRAIRAALPHEPLLYLADSRYAPYGPRDDDFIADRALAIGAWLVERGAKALVVACNTATAQSVQLLRERLDVPIVGVEPGIKPAALASKTRVAGVLATASTLNSARFAALLARHGRDCRFICQPGHGLVDAIETGDIGSPALRALLTGYLSPMLAQHADTLVLGCTHYPFLSDMLRDIAGERLDVIDTSIAIARQLERLLDAHALRATPPNPLSPRALSPINVVLASTSDGTQLRSLARQLLGIDTATEYVVIDSRRTIDTPRALRVHADA